jgi:hypothetical protein
MMLSKCFSAAMILCANHAGTLATVRIVITNAQTTTALTATSKGTPKDFARMCSVRIATCLVT